MEFFKKVLLYAKKKVQSNMKKKSPTQALRKRT
jgi:hypothetical protein